MGRLTDAMLLLFVFDSAPTDDTASRSSLFATRIRNRCRNLVPFHAA